MKQLAKNNLDGDIKIIEVPSPLAYDGQILVQNAYSLISTGTELSNIEIGKKNIIQKAISRPEEFRKVVELSKKEGIISAYKKAISSLERPNSIGYSSSGVILSVGDGVKGFNVGDKVACGGSGHAEIISVPEKLCVKVSNDVPLDEASFVTVASIALEGVRKSNARIGENVVVIGLGLIGQITLDLLKISGANPIGIDLNKSRVLFAKKRGFNAILRDNTKIERILLDSTSGIGADAVIITANTKTSDPIELAGRIARHKAIVTILGGVGINIPRKDFYNKDLLFNIARSYGPGRYDRNYEIKGNDYPIGFVRWTENRNMKAISKLLEQKSISFSSFISSRFPLEKANKAYESARDENNFGVLFEYSFNILDKPNILVLDKTSTMQHSNLNLGLIGAGNFAQNVFLPIATKNKSLKFVGVCSHDGLKPEHIAQKYGFKFATTDSDEITSHDSIQTVFVMTRNDSHASFVIDALQNDKHVFVEKPLCISRSDLKKIVEVKASSSGSLMIGFNRRFSLHTTKAKSLLKNRNHPLIITYRINSRKLSNTHWASDSSASGGRIIAEMCHFIDLCNFLADSSVVSVKSSIIGESDFEYKNEDTVSVIISYQDGSIATLVYSSEGSESYPKEVIEIHSQGEIIEIRDFNEMVIYNDSGKRKFKSKKQDKGLEMQLQQYVNFLKGKEKIPITFNEIINSTELTFKIVENSRNYE